jgi:hypothetical protein
MTRRKMCGVSVCLLAKRKDWDDAVSLFTVSIARQDFFFLRKEANPINELDGWMDDWLYLHVWTNANGAHVRLTEIMYSKDG